MAFGASEFTISKRLPMGAGVHMVFGKWTPSAAYTSGGELITAAICKAAFAVNTIYWMSFAPLFSSDFATSAFVYFDHAVVSGTSQGKIHVVAMTAAHLHDFKIAASQGGGQALQVSPDSTSTPVIGKTTATALTAVSVQGTSGIQNNAVDTIAKVAAGEATGFNFSTGTHSARFVLFGSA